MIALDPSTIHDPETIARAVLDARGRLLSADVALADLNGRAGGGIGLSLAVPQLAALVWLAQRLDIPVTRRVTVADDASDVELWVRVDPVNDTLRLTARGWTTRPVWRPAADIVPVRSDDAGLAWETDAALRVTFLSGDAGAHGIDPATMLGRPLTALFGFAGVTDASMPILDALARWRPFVDQPATVQATGRAVMLSATIRRDAGGAPAGLTGTARMAVVDPPAADVLSTAFTAGLDRALRTSLIRIVDEAEAMNAQRDGPVAPDYADYAGDIASAGRHLMGLIDDLMDLQAIERRDFAPAADPIDLAEIGRRTASLLSVRADHAGVVIDHPEPGEHTAAIGDPRRVLQILVNLVGNALRYSPAGGRIAIETWTAAVGARIAVTDQGKGIAPEDQARIFVKFERVDPGEAGGNGLGLFIARQLAGAMGGDLTVASAPGQGARFTLTLPAGQPATDQ